MSIVKFLVLPKEQWQGEQVNSVVHKQPRHLKQVIAVFPKESRQVQPLSMLFFQGAKASSATLNDLFPKEPRQLQPLSFSLQHFTEAEMS